ncbi:hypothetical protein MUK60_07455 [Streptomyces sp. LRE541]|uniref:hypothetical protein n=1 Tax=Streptomyces sp. LRE541 TaxID=2931983 RepID=UPI0020106ECB|nr:hypothetical protein [Streptomyces sp. LRE541]UPZ27669.1 hypothetical protein MUK60_07455 [Streptomyces sp. LRE541]
MPGKTWEPTRRGARDLEQHIRKGTVVYTVADIATDLAPYEDPQLYTTHEFTHRSPITNKWMTGHLTAQALLAQAGTVYERPPARMRGMHEPAPQVAGPLGNDYLAYLDEPELRGLDKRARDTSDPRMRRI